MNVGEGAGFRKTGRESESSGLDIAREYFVEPWLVEGHPTALQQLDLGRVNIDAYHLEAEFGHAGRMGCAQVTGTDN